MGSIFSQIVLLLLIFLLLIFISIFQCLSFLLCLVVQWSAYLRVRSLEFSDSLVIRTPSFHWGSLPAGRTKVPKPCTVSETKKKKKRSAERKHNYKLWLKDTDHELDSVILLDHSLEKYPQSRSNSLDKTDHLLGRKKARMSLLETAWRKSGRP